MGGRTIELELCINMLHEFVNWMIWGQLDFVHAPQLTLRFIHDNRYVVGFINALGDHCRVGRKFMSSP